METLQTTPIEYEDIKRGNRIQFQYSPSDFAKWIFGYIPHIARWLLKGIEHSSVSGYVIGISEYELYLGLSDPRRKSSLIGSKGTSFQRERIKDIELLEDIILSNSKS